MSFPMVSFPEPAPGSDDSAGPEEVPPDTPATQDLPLAAESGFAAVNLMPPSLLRRAAMRKAQSQAIIAMVVAVAIVGVLYGLSAMGRISAESQLQAANQRVAAAEAQKAQYRDVPGVYAAIAEAQKELSTAMSQEVQFSAVLTNLGMKIPTGVSLTSLTITVGSAASGKKTSARSATTAGAGTDLGTATFTGVAASMPDVAAFMDALATMPEYKTVHLDNASVGSGTDPGGGASPSGSGKVQFTISAQFTEKALSGRFGTPSGSPTPSAGAPTATGPAGAPSPGGSHG